MFISGWGDLLKRTSDSGKVASIGDATPALLMVMILFPLILWIQFRLLWRSKKKTGPTSTGSDRCPNLFRQYLFVYAVITTQCGFRHLIL